MKNHIDGYFDYKIIKGYKKDGNYIVVSYLDGREDYLDKEEESNILLLMEEQGRDYALGLANKKWYLFKFGSGNLGLIVIFFGTLNWLEKLAFSFDNHMLVLGAIGGSALLGTDIILFKELYKDLVRELNKFYDQEKYDYYFKNKDVLDGYVNINELDDCSFSEVRDMVSWKKKIRKKM